MSHFHVKKGDEVVVIAGREKGRRGKVLKVSGKRERAVVQGLHMMKRHTRKSKENPQSSIVEREGSVHLSNLMAAEKYDARVAARAAAQTPAAAQPSSQP